MGPLTQPALIAQAHAETIALTQLVRKGAPVVYGNFLSVMDLRSIGHVTAAKSAHGQAMQESADSMMAALLSGSSIVFHAAGWLEGGLTMGYEKFVMDLDHCGMMCRMLEGLVIDENQLGREAYRQAGPGEHFLSTDLTLANFETATYDSNLLSNTQSFEQWTESRCKDANQRAQKLWKRMLAEHQPPVLDPGINEALSDFVARRKASVEDMWY